MAKTFHFPLQKVLDLREMIEDLRASRLKHSQARLHEEREKLANLEREKDSLLQQDQTESTQHQKISLKNLQVAMDYVAQLNDTIMSQARQVQKSNEAVNQDRHTLIKASREKKIVALLRDKQFDEYVKQHRKKETIQESEIATRIMARNLFRGG
jgi:flagellar FliJ protein